MLCLPQCFLAHSRLSHPSQRTVACLDVLMLCSGHCNSMASCWSASQVMAPQLREGQSLRGLTLIITRPLVSEWAKYCPFSSVALFSVFQLVVLFWFRSCFCGFSLRCCQTALQLSHFFRPAFLVNEMDERRCSSPSAGCATSNCLQQVRIFKK